jgi:predicted RNA binding protein YcfA (HicA-like mRNA interferase family)
VKVSGKQIVKYLVGDGWVAATLHGSHVKLKKYGKEVTVPLYNETPTSVLAYISTRLGLEKTELLAKLR